MNTDFLSPEHITAASSNSRWHGAVEGLHDQILFGWAFDSERPEARVIVEVCLDGIPCACIAADVARTDLTEEFSRLNLRADVCHGFVADLNALPIGTKGVITARIANTDAVLRGTMLIGETRTLPAAALNSVVGDGGLRLFGWAVDAMDPNRTVTVQAFIGSEMVAATSADIVVPSMRGLIDGPHGFDLALPVSLADGRTHQVRVVDDSGYPLNGSPLIVCCTLNGLAALLPKDVDELTLEVAAIYERLVPRSIPLTAWPQWKALFDNTSVDHIALASTNLKTGLLVITECADETAIQRTVRSLQDQSSHVQVYAGFPFAKLLADAVASGCEVIGIVRPGDTLPPNAITYALAAFESPGAQAVYTDSEQGGQPWFKPAWNLDYALASDYPLELLLIRASVVKRLAPLANEAEFAWLSLASLWGQGEESIVHVPRVLYQVNSALSQEELQRRHQAALRAIGSHEPAVTLHRLEITRLGSAHEQTHAARRVHASLPEDADGLTISLIIPTRDRTDLMRRCIDSIRKFTRWPELEILVIDNGSVEPVTHAYFDEISAEGVRVLPMPGPFNYADLNNRAVELASGEIIGLINNDIEALHDGWLEEIVAQLLRPGVGAVGAKLLWPNGMVQHGGVLLGVGNVAGHFGNRLADNDWGDHGRNQLVQRVSGCTAACLFLRKQDFLALGGMDAHAFPVAFNDVDLCLKLRASGKSIIWTPHAKLLHAESASRGHEDTPQKRARAQREIHELRRRWGDSLMHDPAYHPSLNLDPNSHAFGGLAIPPRTRQARIPVLKGEVNAH